MDSILKKMTKSTAALIAVIFACNMTLVPASYAQVSFLPEAGAMVKMTAKFDPMLVKGIKLYPDNPFKFDFIVDKGQQSLNEDQIKAEGQKMVSYFLAALTTPEKEMWVNLSPYEKSRIIPAVLGDTEMGKEMLAQDYVLKQIMATALYPEQEMGKEFWAKVYAQAQAQFGTTNLPISSFNKVWIVPSEAVVYENASMNAVFVVKSSLKVMMEEDYLAANKSKAMEQFGMAQLPTVDAAGALSSKLIKQIIIPVLEKEVNEGANFVKLRQVYQSLILAAWYKKNLKDNVLAQGYVNQGKTTGVDTQDKEINQKIYQQYLKAYKKGTYSYIKEEIDPATNRIIPRKYFSGGVAVQDVSRAMRAADPAQVSAFERVFSSRAGRGALLTLGAVGIMLAFSTGVQAASVQEQAKDNRIVASLVSSKQFKALSGTRLELSANTPEAVVYAVNQAVNTPGAIGISTASKLIAGGAVFQENGKFFLNLKGTTRPVAAVAAAPAATPAVAPPAAVTIAPSGPAPANATVIEPSPGFVPVVRGAVFAEPLPAPATAPAVAGSLVKPTDITVRLASGGNTTVGELLTGNQTLIFSGSDITLNAVRTSLNIPSDVAHPVQGGVVELAFTPRVFRAWAEANPQKINDLVKNFVLRSGASNTTLAAGSGGNPPDPQFSFGSIAKSNVLKGEAAASYLRSQGNKTVVVVVDITGLTAQQRANLPIVSSLNPDTDSFTFAASGEDVLGTVNAKGQLIAGYFNPIKNLRVSIIQDAPEPMVAALMSYQEDNRNWFERTIGAFFQAIADALRSLFGGNVQPVRIGDLKQTFADQGVAPTPPAPAAPVAAAPAPVPQAPAVVPSPDGQMILSGVPDSIARNLVYIKNTGSIAFRIPVGLDMSYNGAWFSGPDSIWWQLATQYNAGKGAVGGWQQGIKDYFYKEYKSAKPGTLILLPNTIDVPGDGFVPYPATLNRAITSATLPTVDLLAGLATTLPKPQAEPAKDYGPFVLHTGDRDWRSISLTYNALRGRISMEVKDFAKSGILIRELDALHSAAYNSRPHRNWPTTAPIGEYFQKTNMVTSAAYNAWERGVEGVIRKFNAQRSLTVAAADRASVAYGGIDLEKVNVMIKNGGAGIKTAFSDPKVLEMLRNSAGLFPEIQSVIPMTVPMVNMLLGLNVAPANDNNPAVPAKSAAMPHIKQTWVDLRKA